MGGEARASRAIGSEISTGSQRMPAGSGRYPSGQRGQTVNLLAHAFGGSNPPLPTTVHQGRKRGNSSAVERQPSKLGVAGSNPVSRSRVVGRAGGRRGAGAPPSEASERRDPIGRAGGHRGAGEPEGGVASWKIAPPSEASRRAGGDRAHVAQTAERVLGKDEVSSSIPDMGSPPRFGIAAVNGR